MPYLKASLLLAAAFAPAVRCYYASADEDASRLVPELLRAQETGRATRADFSRVQLTYLGRDRVLAFNQWTGEYALWQFEREGLSKCDPLTWPPLSNGRWAALRYTEFVFVGFTQLLSLDPRAGTLTVSECDEEAFLPRCRGKALHCSPLFTATLDGHGSGHELTYLGQDLLLHYERSTGAYAFRSFTRDCGGKNESSTGEAPRCGLSAPLATGSLPLGAHHSYLGSGHVLAFLPHSGGSYELYKVNRPDANATSSAPSIVRVSGGAISLNSSFTHEAVRHRLLPLHNGLLLDYDKESAQYRLLDLMTTVGVRSGLSAADATNRAGSLLFAPLATSTIPASATDGCAAYGTSATCLGASAQLGCGWCQASGRCVRGDPWGPCTRANCVAAQAACGMWHSPSGVIQPTDPSAVSTSASPNLVSPPALVPPSTDAAECTACDGAGMGLHGGTAEALNHCAKCAAAGSNAEPDADGRVTVTLTKGATKATNGAAFRLAAFVLKTLQDGPCAQLSSPLCATLVEGYVSRITSATASGIQTQLRPHESKPVSNHSVETTLEFVVAADVKRVPGAPSAAFDNFAGKDPYAPADPDTLNLRVVLEPPSGLAEDNGTLVLASATVSLANGAPLASGLPSLISEPFSLGSAAFRAFFTPTFDPTATAHTLTPDVKKTRRLVTPQTFDEHELSYLGYDAVLDYAPHTGQFVIWQLDATAATSDAAPLLTPPLAGSTWRVPFRRFAYLGFDWWLEYAPTTGAYNMHRCTHERWRLGLPPLCAPLCPAAGCGTSTDLAGDTRVMYLGHDAVLALHLSTGAYAVLRVDRSSAKLETAPAESAAMRDDAAPGLRGTLPALAGREVAFIGNHMLVAIDKAGKEAQVFLLARNASEVWAHASPLRAALTTPPSTAAILASGSRDHGGRLVGLSGGRVLTVAPRASAGFSYELIRCEPVPCAPADCALLGPMAPTSGEVICKPLGAGDVGADGTALQTAARVRDAAVESTRHDAVADVDAEGTLEGSRPIALPSVVPPARGSGRRQWVLLDASGDSGASNGGLSARALLEYDAPSADVRILRLALPAPLPTTPAASAVLNAALISSTAAAAAAISTCDAIPLPAAKQGSWAFPSHRLSSLGGTAVLDVDVETSQFRVWECARAVPPPATPALDAAAAVIAAAGEKLPAVATAVAATAVDAALPCVAVDHGVWPPLSAHAQAVWLGPTLDDALLLFDDVSGHYEAWPLRRLKPRTMPRPGQRALAGGTWSRLIGRTLVHAGGSTLLALEPSTGRYELLLLDSSAFLAPAKPRLANEPPPTISYGQLASGTLGNPTTAAAADVGLRPQPSAAAAAAPIPPRPCAFAYHSPSYLGDDLLVSIDPASGSYCMLRLSREKPQLPPLEHVGGGNLHRAPCGHSSCSACSAEEGCGWCALSGQCLQGNAIGPCGGGCSEHWTYGYCADEPCSQHSTCGDCLATDLCGWCASKRQCMAGSVAEPLHLQCPGGYRYQTCGGRGVNETFV